VTDRIWLMAKGRGVQIGLPEDFVIEPETGRFHFK
jgi:ABC-type proline/glycine betaine transport system ATPase subunit